MQIWPPDRATVVLNDQKRPLPTPKTKKELVSQFALFQYYKKFIPAFSDIAKPLQALLSSDNAKAGAELSGKSIVKKTSFGYSNRSLVPEPRSFCSKILKKVVIRNILSII